MSSQTFNQKVSIITKSEIRYEGNIFQINQQEQKITLKDVRSFGTEGRRPGDEIPATMTSYPNIVFRAHEIKDLQIIQSAPEVNQEKQQQPQEKQKEKQEERQTSSVQVTQEAQQTRPKNIEDRTFNFDSMLELITDLEQRKNEPNQKPRYQKSNFFDEISSTVNQKQLGPRQMTKEERKHQNDQDTETFGQFYKHQNGYNKQNQQKRGKGGGGGLNRRGTYDKNTNYQNKNTGYGEQYNNRDYYKKDNNRDYYARNNDNEYRKQDRPLYVEKQVEKKD